MGSSVRRSQGAHALAAPALSGALLLVGTLLPWASITVFGRFKSDFAGVQSTWGKAVLVAAFVIQLALLGTRWSKVAAFVASLIAALCVWYFFANLVSVCESTGACAAGNISGLEVKVEFGFLLAALAAVSAAIVNGIYMVAALVARDGDVVAVTYGTPRPTWLAGSPAPERSFIAEDDLDAVRARFPDESVQVLDLLSSGRVVPTNRAQWTREVCHHMHCGATLDEALGHVHPAWTDGVMTSR